MIKGTAKYVPGVYGVYVKKAQECSENRFTAAERERKREPQRRLRGPTTQARGKPSKWVSFVMSPGGTSPGYGCCKNV